VQALQGSLIHLLGSTGPDADRTEMVEQLTPEMIECLNNAVQKGHVLWQQFGVFVIDIGHDTVVKAVQRDSDAATNLQFVTELIPEIPAPRSLGVIASDRTMFEFMTRARGVTLESVWPRLSTSQKTSVQHQLSPIFTALRSHIFVKVSSTGKLGSFISGLVIDQRLFKWTAYCCYSSKRNATDEQLYINFHG